MEAYFELTALVNHDEEFKHPRVEAEVSAKASPPARFHDSPQRPWLGMGGHGSPLFYHQ